MNEREIFQGALDHADPAYRQAFLEQACGTDSALRTRIEALLLSHAAASQFLKVPALEQINPPAEGLPQHTVDFSQASGNEAGGNDRIDDDSEAAPDLSFLQPPSQPGSIGRLGHYEILQVLGQGAFGIVFKAFDEKLHRLVAIKAMNPQLAATSPPRKRFLREARSAAAIRHENIVQVYSVEEEPLPYLVMEYIDGQSLKEKLDSSGPLDAPEILHLGRQMANGLAAAHAQGLIHRDIKPGNILLEQGAEQRVKITDFGLARAADDATMTRTGVISGTPMFMAPEQAQGLALDHRADLFSLGSVLYQLASGRAPFRAATAIAVLKRVTDEAPRPIQEIIPEVPDWLCAIVARLQAKKPEDRFQSAKEVAELLAACQAKLQQHGPVESLPEILPLLPKLASAELKPVPAQRPQAEKNAFRHHRGWIAAAAVFLALLTGLGMTEATGVTNIRGTVIRLFTPEGTLVVEVDDPGVSVSIDGEDIVITGAGVKEIRLNPGQHKVLASKDGKLLTQEIVTVARNGRQVVRLSKEARPVMQIVPENGATSSQPKAAADPDRRAAEWVLSVDGNVRGASEPGRLFKAGDPIPPGEWKLIMANVTRNPRATDAELAVFENCQKLSVLILSDTPVTDAGLVYFKDSKDLLSLDLARTEVTDEGLAVFKGHKRLEQLDLSGTRVTDRGLLVLGNRNAYRLLLADTGVGDAGLAIFENSQNLKTLVLSGTKVTDDGLAHFRGCQRLEHVHLERLPIGDAGLAVFKDFENLAELRLNGTQVSDAGLGFIPKMKSHGGVGLRQTKVTAAGVNKLAAAQPDLRIEWDGGVIEPKKVSADPDRRAAEYVLSIGGQVGIGFEGGPNSIGVTRLPEQSFLLTRVSLSHNEKVTDAGLAAFEGCKSLVYLNLDTTAVTDAGMAHFKECKNLEYLNLISTEIGDNGLAHFAGCKDIRNLLLMNTQVGDRGLAGFKGCSKLQSLDLGAPAVSDVGLENFNNCVDLEFLNLNCPRMTDAAMANFKHCKKLQGLGLRGAFTDAGMEYFRGCGELKEIGVQNSRVSGAILGWLDAWPKLHGINLTNQPVTDAHLAFLKDGNPLTWLTIGGHAMTDAGMTNLVRCQNLKSLNVASPEITDAGLEPLHRMKNLRKLTLLGNNYTAEGVKKLAAALPDCEITWNGQVMKSTR